MTCSTCPSCGFDLERIETLTLGELKIVDRGARILWRGKRVKLEPVRRLLVCAIARGDGHAVAKAALIEAIGNDDSAHPSGLVHTHMCRTRQAFRAIDPTFDRIETVRGAGFRWRVEE